MDDFKKLFQAKRILALILAVAMAVTMLPTTTYAASPDTPVARQDDEAESEAPDQEDGSEALQPAGSNGEDIPQEEGQEEGTSQPDGSGTVPADVPGIVSEPAEGTDSEDTDPTEPAETEGTAAIEENVEVAEDAKVTYTFDISSLHEADTTKPYNQGGPVFYFNNFKSKIEINGGGRTYNLGNSSSTVVTAVTHKWQEKAPVGYKDMPEGESPRDAGAYQLVISIPEGNGANAAAASVEIPFTVTKSPVRITDYSLNTVKPGSKPSEVKITDVNLEADDGKYGFTTNITDGDTVPETYDIAISLKVKNAMTGEEPAELLKSEEYVAEVTAAFSDKADAAVKKNYEIQPCTITNKVSVGNLKKSKVALTLTNADLKGKAQTALRTSDGSEVTVITKQYDKASVSLKSADYTVKISEPVTGEDGKETLADIAGAAPEEGEWHTADFNVWEEGRTDAEGNAETVKYCSLTVGGALNGEPAEAGAYAYKVAYAGKEGVYEESFAYIVVEIKPLETVIEPKAQAGAVFYKNMTVADALGKMSYTAYGAADTAKTAITDFSLGTSFADNNQTQPYEPVFEIVEVTTKDGQVLIQRTLGLNEKLTDPAKVAAGYKKEYKVRFTGQKAVYNFDGQKITDEETGNKIWVDIIKTAVDVNAPVNSSSTNYTVLTDGKKLDETALALELTGTLKTIDTSKVPDKVENARKDAAFHNAVTKAWDGYDLYAKRGDYKVATTGDAELDKSLSYEWYELTDEDVSDAIDVQLLDDESGLTWTRMYSFGRNGCSPYDVGIYKLVISLDDPSGQNYAEKAEVYFVIEQQQVKAVPAGEYKVYAGTGIDQFLQDINGGFITVDNSIKLRQGNTGNNWVDPDPLWTEYTDYYVEWEVTKKLPTADGDRWVSVYGGTFQEGTEYRLEVSKINFWGRYDGRHTYQEHVLETDKDGNKDDSWNLLSTETAAIKVNKAGAAIQPSKTDIYKEKVYDGKPIDMAAELAEVKAVLSSDGKTAANAALEFIWEDTETYGFVSPEDAYKGGTYNIYAYFTGDETYAPISRTLVAEAVIKPKKLTLVPEPLTVKAGVYYSSLSYPSSSNSVRLDISKMDIVAGDELGFEWNGYHYPAWESWPGFTIKDSKGKNYNGYLKSSEKYTISVSSTGSLQDIPLYAADNGVYGDFAKNYKLEIGGSAEVTVEKDPLKVTATDYSNIKKIDISDSLTDLSHSVAFQDGIEYSSYRKAGKEVYGNFVALNIRVPDEFSRDDNYNINTAVYKNSIGKAKGSVVEEYSDSSYITVIFDASEKNDKGEVYDREFSIRWEEGYTETYKLLFTKATLLQDLKEAVAPKSLSFNSPKKKMVVGEIQDLDVKITKFQKSDVICLEYKVADADAAKNILSVSEQGKVTALQAGTATVEVYPVKLANGKKVPIDGAKPVTQPITVTEVEAPKGIKTTQLDKSVTVQYPYISDTNYYTYGYRREIYIMPGKQDETAFEAAIKKLANAQWEAAGFAAKPVFLTSSEEKDSRLWDAKKKAYVNTVAYTVGGLKRNTAYTVYVRNVSGERTLSDGSKVVLSAKGAVKDFTTTPSQVRELEMTLKGKEVTLDCAMDHTEHGDMKCYELDMLKDSSVDLETIGWFDSQDLLAEDVFDDESGTAYYDGDGFVLPVPAAQKKTYIDPKLEYYFVDEGDLYTSNKYASVKKGKITLLQPGTIYVIAMDSVTRTYSNVVKITITATPDSIKGKATTLQTGQSIRLDALVDYKAGSKVLKPDSIFKRMPKVDDTLKTKIEQDGYFKLENYDGVWYVRALKDQGNISFDYADANAELSPTNVTIKSKALDAVKNLKTVDVVDNRVTIQFEQNPYADAYRIDVRDARGTLIRSAYVENFWLDEYDWVSDDDDDYSQGYWNVHWDYTLKKALCEYDITRLTQQSKYNVTVTALYGAEQSKPMSKPVTTTKMPASYADLDIGGRKYYNGDLNEWGMRLFAVNYEDDDLDSTPFVSGNDYTLAAYPDNWKSQYAVTDKLTWSCDNKKVATIKAVGGTYSASLKTVGAGTATIEVKSGITKKVISRYKITVRPVGDAYNYYGDNEYLNNGTPEANRKTYTEITLGNPVAVELSAGQTKWFTFTAPEEGTYKAYRVVNGRKVLMYSSSEMDEGKLWKFSVSVAGSYTVIIEKVKTAGKDDRTPLTLNKPVTMDVSYGQCFVFTAPETGVYSFNGTYFYLYTDIDRFDDGYADKSGYDINYGLQKGETVYLKVSFWEEDPVTIEVKALSTPLEVGKGSPVEEDSDSWFVFTAPEDAEYRFELSEEYSGYIYCYENPSFSYSDGYGYGSLQKQCEAKKVYWVKVHNWNPDCTLTVTKVTANAE